MCVKGIVTFVRFRTLYSYCVTGKENINFKYPNSYLGIYLIVPSGLRQVRDEND